MTRFHIPPASVPVRQNTVNGEHYDDRHIQVGLFVCPNCRTSHMQSCVNCGRPDEFTISSQWGPVEQFDMVTGHTLSSN